MEPLMTKLTIVSFNCLNPKYGISDRYYVYKCKLHCDDDCHINHYLPWENRKQKLIEFIVNLNPDILCLQEITHQIAYDICRALKGTLVMSYRKTDNSDGCAIIWTSKKLQSFYLEYYNGMYPSNEHLIQYCQLQLLSDDKKIMIMNTHVNYPTRNEDIKDVLWCNFTRIIEKNPITILIGDFNAEVDEDWHSLFDEKWSPSYVDVFKDERPLFTFINSHKDKPFEKKTIDHCFISGIKKNNIFPASFKEYEEFDYLPNSIIPSDHLPIIVAVII